jgi:hypothetical protein
MGMESMIDAGDHIRAVGWLSAGQPFAQGDVPPEFLDRLREFVRLWWPSTEALGWSLALGKHCCELCHDFYAGGNIGVPDGQILFAAPEMIAHYVEKHQYRPPAEFVAAVLKSPLPGTEEYRAAVEPFRLLHVALLESEREDTIAHAARWALTNGTDEREAASRFLGSYAEEDRERVRKKMQELADKG